MIQFILKTSSRWKNLRTVLKKGSLHIGMKEFPLWRKASRNCSNKRHKQIQFFSPTKAFSYLTTFLTCDFFLTWVHPQFQALIQLTNMWRLNSKQHFLSIQSFSQDERSVNQHKQPTPSHFIYFFNLFWPLSLSISIVFSVLFISFL